MGSVKGKKKLNLDDFKKEYELELSHWSLLGSANALFDELQRAYNNNERFTLKIRAIFTKLNKEYDEWLPRIYEAYKRGEITKGQPLLKFQRPPLRAPDLRGLHRRKQIPPSQELLKEYNEVRGTLRSKMKRAYRNRAAKIIRVREVLFEALKLNLPEGELKKCVSHSPSDIALQALAYKHKVSASTIKKALAMGKATALVQGMLTLTPLS